MRGWRSLQLGRVPLTELTTYYAAKPVEVKVAALLIRINRLYRHNMSAEELYEATRDAAALRQRSRQEFLGHVADARIRDAYVGRSVAKQFEQGQRSPVLYANC